METYVYHFHYIRLARCGTQLNIQQQSIIDDFSMNMISTSLVLYVRIKNRLSYKYTWNILAGINTHKNNFIATM